MIRKKPFFLVLIFVIISFSGGILGAGKEEKPLFPLVSGEYWKYVSFGTWNQGSKRGIGLSLIYLLAPMSNYRNFLKTRDSSLFMDVYYKYESKANNNFFIHQKSSLTKIIGKTLWKKSKKVTEGKPKFFTGENFFKYPLYSDAFYPLLWYDLENYLLYQKGENILKFLYYTGVTKISDIKDEREFWRLLNKEISETSALFLPVKSSGKEGWINYYSRENGTSWMEVFTLRAYLKNYLLRVERYRIREKNKIRFGPIPGMSIKGEAIETTEMEILPGVGITKMKEDTSPGEKKGAKVESYLLEYYNPETDFTWKIGEETMKEVRKKIREVLKNDLKKKVKDTGKREEEVEKKVKEIEEKMNKDFFELRFEEQQR